MTTNQQIIRSLQRFITPERFSRYQEVLAKRTRFLTLVLEDIYQPHNASAVLRSCDCFGVQDVHIIETRNRYEVNPDVALGSAKWLTLNRYHGTDDNTRQCLLQLREKGYRLVAATPHKNDHTPDTLPLHEKTALLFGTELTGLTPEALELADDFIRIPMAGFTESLNISVSAAILLQTLTSRLWSGTTQWQLTGQEADEIMVQWLSQSVKGSEQLIREINARPEPEKSSGKSW